MAAGESPDRGPWRELASLGLIVAVSILVDPVQRRNTRMALERALRSVDEHLSGPAPRLPAPAEIAALHNEARKITREAAGDDG